MNMEPSAGVPEPVAQDAQTLTDVISELERAGYVGQFRVLEFGRLQCLSCRQELDGHEIRIDSIQRLEGASDPADMLAVPALSCPRCQTHGTVILSYGPDATLEESALLLALNNDRDDQSPPSRLP
jgi:hypothetical protein